MRSALRHLPIAALVALCALLASPPAAGAAIPKPPAAPLAYTVSSTNATITNAVDLQIAINAEQAEVSSLDERITAVTGSAQEQSSTLAAALASYDSAQKVFDDRVVQMYQAGDYGIFDILLDARSFQDLLARVELVTRILESDSSVLAELSIVAEQAQFQAGRLTDLQAELTTLQAARDQRGAELASSQAQLLAAEALIPASAETLLSSVRSQFGAYRARWAAASVPETASVVPVSVKVTPGKATCVGSPFAYRSYRASGITVPASATWYGHDFDGHATTSSELFNSSDFTCAHMTLPIGTWLAVTRTDPVTHAVRRVVVVVNDRGPYSSGADLQLSAAAARALGLTDRAPTPVSMEVVKPVQ